MTSLFVLGAVTVAAVVTLLAALVRVLRKTRLGERRERWQDQTTGPAGAMFNALFLMVFALSAVIAWQAYDRATTHAYNESSALIDLHRTVAALPAGPRLRDEVRDYTRLLVQRDWPGLAAQEVDQRLDRLTDDTLAVQSADPAAQALRTQALKNLDNAALARQDRLHDATTSLPTGLLVCLLIAAAAAVGHALLMGLPHTAPSLTPLLVETALITGGVFIVFLIRAPYHGLLALAPDQLTSALVTFTAGDR